MAFAATKRCGLRHPRWGATSGRAGGERSLRPRTIRLLTMRAPRRSREPVGSRRCPPPACPEVTPPQGSREGSRRSRSPSCNLADDKMVAHQPAGLNVKPGTRSHTHLNLARASRVGRRVPPAGRGLPPRPTRVPRGVRHHREAGSNRDKRSTMGGSPSGTSPSQFHTSLMWAAIKA